LTAEEIFGSEVAKLFSSQAIPSLLEQIERRRIRGHNQFEFYLPRSNGRHLPVVVTARQIQAPDGRPYAVVTVRDISEQNGYRCNSASDISGHGIGSALVANRIYTETKSQLEHGAGPGPMLQHLNNFAIQNLSSSAFYFTLAAMRLDGSGRLLDLRRPAIRLQ
jgi:stage II sporulation SpoE-like protein/PAS domain-containing protein